ncbi:hypothetical protein Dfri01_02550 [Dyadobacter frigoris]|uniref:hypothetical protein n=1 Tax=Dyadobacter frigoris TaxID=2576211 RepID=UPI00249FD8D3|nr:hypothetical protein [Dyadobacter frigoris]GLU50794.1 hypothetical protein Dfri01_02550 [Dyadobacter frigoris]
MKEFPDDELDKLFRKSAEELDSNFDPQDWNALRKRLDENDGRTAAAWFKKWWPVGLLALLMLGGLTTYLLTGKENDTEKSIVNKESLLPTQRSVTGRDDKQIAEKVGTEIPEKKPEETKNGREKSESNIVESKSDKGLAINGEKSKKAIHSSEKDYEVKSGVNSKAVEESKLAQPEQETTELLIKNKNNISKSTNPKILPRRWSKTGGVYLEPNHSIGRRGDGAFLSKNNDNQKVDDFVKSDVAKVKPDKTNLVISNLTGDDNSGNGKNYVPIVDKMDKTVDEIDLNNEIARLNISASKLKSRSLIWKKPNSLPEVEVKEAEVQPVSEQPVKETSEKELIPKFAVRFGYSPDISSVGLKNFSKPGTAVSLLIEYSIFQKLYIQTGVIRSSKVYNAKAGEYEWPDSWKDQKVLPTSVDGVCKIIEIPLNVRYDISQNARSRWFAGAGTSSYYMQNEKYEYNYPPKTYGKKWEYFEVSTGWYLFSHINASAGYEYRFSKKLSLLAEPYVRIPVKKVGYGKVDLLTTGVWFSIRYTPTFKK